MTKIEQMIREEGRKEGLRIGIENSKIEIAQKALSAGIDEEIVLKITGLTKETLKKIKKVK